MDFRRIAALACAASVLLMRPPFAMAQGEAKPATAMPAPVTAPHLSPAPVSPAVPTFATLWAEYERRFLISAAKSEHSAITFISFDAPPIAQSVLGSSWPLVREEALRLLNTLPIYDPVALDAQKWTGEYSDVFEPFSKPTPAHLAAARLWNPTIALSAVTMTLVTEHLPQERLRDDMLIASNASVHSYSATWRGKTALVAEYGYWLVAMEYMLTKEGMFVPVRAAIGRREF